jgi:hypothetical protein
MIIKRIENASRTFGAPHDWKNTDGPCQGLPVLDVVTEEGLFMISAWEPTPEELAALNRGESIKLWVRGTVHPVVALSVGPVPLGE